MMNGSWKGFALATVLLGSVSASCEGLGPATDPLSRMACPELGGNALGGRFTAEAKANATIAAFVQATADLRDVTVRMEAEVTGACERMASDLGIPREQLAAKPGTGGAVKGACEPVLAKIDALMRAGVNAQIKMTFTAPECKVAANAYASCAGQCNVNVDPGYIVAHCTPGQLSGISKPNMGSRTKSTLSRAPFKADRKAARVCEMLMRFPMPKGPPVQPVFTSQHDALWSAIFFPRSDA